MAQKRLMKDIEVFANGGPEGITAELVGGDIFHWKAVIPGPQGTPYEGGRFKVEVKFPFDYPLKPPVCTFETRIYHPNIGPNGKICLDIFSKAWTPLGNASKVLLSLYYLLSTPDPDDALSTEIANQYKKDRALFDATARQWTEEYAKE